MSLKLRCVQTAVTAAFVCVASGCELSLPSARQPAAQARTPAPTQNAPTSKAASASEPAGASKPAAAESSIPAQAGRAAPSPADTPQIEIVPPNGEVCDRRDNDDNGIVDDADVEGDGVCDCLKIASMGRPGAFGKGDLQFRTWPNAMAQNHVVSLGDAQLSAELLAEYDVLIVLNVSTVASVSGEKVHHVFSDDEVSAFERWVRAGGGAFTTAGYSGEIAAEVANVNKLLAPFKLAYSPSQYGLDGIITRWSAHPITEGVRRVYAEAGLVPDGPSALTLATDPTEHVALQVPKEDSAKIIVWGDEWITYASQWQAEADQQVERFWVNALTWLSRESSCQHTIRQRDR
jgi:hypothetical protein